MRCFFFLLLAVNLIGAGSVQAQPFALEQLEASPRHHEWLEIPAGDRTVYTFAAYPEVSEPVATVLIIHENRGLTDWVRSFADQVAAAGYLALAPDLLSEFDQERQQTRDFETSDAARTALYELDMDQVMQDLAAVQAYTAQIPSASGTVVVAGFCWGGARTFQYATRAEGLAAAFVFYGSPPAADALPGLNAPIYGFYGEDDARINATIPDTEAAMDALGQTYEYVIYEGAGHAFMRRGDDPAGSAANIAAREAAWTRLKALLDDVS
ncbi:MAG: dienelactone hydrolase family protein [Bacteroidota bacterium]